MRRRSGRTINGVRDPLDPWLTWSAVGLATLAVGFALIAAFTAAWFNRVLVSQKHKFANGLTYESRSFTLHQLANHAHNPGRFGDAATLLLIGSIILAGAAVVVLIARSHLRARAGACVAMAIGALFIGWSLELAKSPLPSRVLVAPAILWENAGEPGTAATQGAGACEAAAILGLLAATFATLAWRRASWFKQRWGIEPTDQELDTTPLTPGRQQLVI
jgi:hypothetical protein